MGLFDKLFGSETKTQPQSDSNINNKVKKTIFDFFKINLLELPNDSFVEGESELNASGDTIQHYRAGLDYLECDLFDTVELIKFQNGSCNIFFKYYNLSKVRIDKVKKLIDSLYLIYGVDDSDKGKFTDNDLNDYNSKEFYMLFGRRWSDEKYKYPIAVDIDRESNVITLSIWGIKLNKL